jgi:hypothetical protein
MSQPQGHSAAGRIVSIKYSSYTIGNRTRVLPACSAVPQPNALPRALPTILNKDNNMVFFAEDTSIIITYSYRRDLNINANQMFQYINTWFNSSLLTLNFNKIKYLEFRAKNFYNFSTKIKYNQEFITNATGIKFLGLTIDYILSWKQYIEQVINKMCSACYALRYIKHMVPVDTLRVIYFAHMHFIINYGTIFWGSSYYSNKVFILQRKLSEL